METGARRRVTSPAAANEHTATVVADNGSKATGSRARLPCHLFCLAVYSYIHWCDYSLFISCPEPKKYYLGAQTFGGRRKYLTYLTLWVTLLYFGIASLIDIAASLGQFKAGISFSDGFFVAVVWPMNMIVVVFFWGIYAIDRELIFPVRLDEYFPQYINHFWHTAPLIIIVLELFLIRHRQPSHVKTTCMMLIIAVLYGSWVGLIYYMTGKWIYPFMSNFTVLGFVGFSVTASLIGLMFHYIGRYLSSLRWNYL